MQLGHNSDFKAATFVSKNRERNKQNKHKQAGQMSSLWFCHDTFKLRSKGLQKKFLFETQM